MQLVHKTLFASELLTIRHAIARPSSRAGSEVLHGAADLLLLPIAGVFAKHESPQQRFIANANHALFFGYEKPYRISFPGDQGDESLVLRFSQDALTDLLIESVGVDQLFTPRLHTHCLLAPAAMLQRDLLWYALQGDAGAPLAIEEIGAAILAAALAAARKDIRQRCGVRATQAATLARRHRQVESVKEAISLDPAREWTLDMLARAANTSPFHLARIFREDVGVPVYRYLIRTRLGQALERMRGRNVGLPANLTDIALEAGFSTHSHFSSSFRALFGIAPSQLRRRIDGG